MSAAKSENAAPESAPKDGKKKTINWAEFVKGLEKSFILLFAGACLIFVSIVIWGHATHIGSHSYPLWAMFFIAGLVAVTGGFIASLVPDEEEEIPESTDTYVVVPRDKWDSSLKELTELRTLTNKVMPAAEAVKAKEQPKAKAEQPKTEGPSVVDWEAAAFQAAHSTGLNRNPNESANDYCNRANRMIAKGTNTPGPVAMAGAVHSTLMESLRSLSEVQMDKLSTALEEPNKRFAEDIKVPRNSGEKLLDYVTRALKVLETPPKKEEPVASPKELQSLNWALTLFQVFLEGYIGMQETAEVIADAEKGAGVEETQKHFPKPVKEDEFMTYARLVKNSLRTLSARGIEKEKADKVLREFEEFVGDMSESAPNVPGITKSPEEVKKEAPERIKKMFEWVGQGKEEKRG
jgi:hypothetical protein